MHLNRPTEKLSTGINGVCLLPLKVPTMTETAGAIGVLPDVARQLARASISTNTRVAYTRVAYTRVLRRLDAWLAARALDDAALASHLAELHQMGRAPATAAMVVAAVRFRAKLAGEASPVGPATDRVLAGIRREGRNRGRGQVAGVRWEQADAAAAVATNGGGSVTGLRDAAILALASDAMLRVSECAALEVADLAIEPDATGRVLAAA